MNDITKAANDVAKAEGKPVELMEDALKAAQQPAAPALRGEIIIRLLADGDIRVTGPLDDAILFKGMVAMAYDVQNAYMAKREKDMARLASLPPAKRENAFSRIVRLAREKKAKLQAEAAAAKQAEADRKKAEELAAEGKITKTPPQEPVAEVTQGGTPSQEVKA